ncbi:MAG: carboxypeptidase-like regulatory domain-containing protein [Fuerstiella sp.]|nr:carboxypeptidase-like regulatory domain-containing protein [Fuerstiella sp.]
MRSSLIFAIAVSLLMPQGTLLAADTVTKSSTAAVPPRLKDVELGVGGVLNGQLVDAAGNPVGAVAVSVILGDTEIKVVTDRAGRFAVSHLKGGLCVIKIDDASYACRLWHRGTAPPNAIDSIAVVQEGNVARGQQNCPPRKRLHRLTSEQCGALFLTGLTGTAIALALTQDAS